MANFLSCDWGTSSFRLRLVEGETATVLSEVSGQQGIASTYAAWQQSGRPERERQSFYWSILAEQVERLSLMTKTSLGDAPLIVSGMASSTIGMLELPYKKVPFALLGDDLLIESFPKTADLSSKIHVISGVSTGTDVLRGEETILTGCDVRIDSNNRLLIFPGTHSKHVLVQNGKAVDFKTYMTGELFELLAYKSILSSSVKKSDADDGSTSRYFAEGVTLGARSDLLGNAFGVRVNQLFGRLSPEDNYDYLSGLLIGCELSNVQQQGYASITLVASKTLQPRYKLALQTLGINGQVLYENADAALVKGQARIYRTLVEKGLA